MAFQKETKDIGTNVVQVIDPQVARRDDSDPSQKSIAREVMGDKWALPNALLGGTMTMREAGRTYLPQETAEKDPAYKVRLHRSFLLNAYRDAVDSTAGKPFSKEVTFGDTTPEEIQALAKNIDLRGRTLTQFAADMMKTGWHYGLAHFMVDFPQMDVIPTQAQVKAENIRPYFVSVNPEHVLGWRSTRINGVETLTQLRIREDTVEPSGEFGEAVVCRIRVWTLNFEVVGNGVPEIKAVVRWQLYREDGQKVWVSDGEGSLEKMDRIPFVTFYVARTGFMTADPPLEDLAWINLAHWQSSSDQRNILRFSRHAQLFGAGIEESEIKNSIAFGANFALFAKNANAKLEMVEHSGTAIGAGQADLVALEEQMVIVGLTPQLKRTGSPTATAVALDTATSDSPLVASARHAEQALEAGFDFAAKWMEMEDVENDVSIAEEFGLSLRSSEYIKTLIESRKNGDISRETFLEELRRLGVLSETFNIQREMQRIESETPTPPTPTPAPTVI